MYAYMYVHIVCLHVCVHVCVCMCAHNTHIRDVSVSAAVTRSWAVRSPDLLCVPRMDTPMCPGTTLQCTCAMRGDTSITRWRLSISPPICPGNSISLPQTPPCAGEDVPTSMGHCGPLVVGRNVLNGSLEASCTTSEVHITAHSSIDNMEVVCEDVSSSPPVGTAAGTVRVVGECTQVCVC